MSVRRLVLLVGLALFAIPGTASATTFTVNRTSDSTPGLGSCEPGFCTLRQAIEAAAKGSGNVVVVPGGLYSISEGQLVVNKPMTIEGAGAGATVVDAGGLSRVIEFTAAASPARLAGMTLQKGQIYSKFAVSGGGGISNAGSLTLEEMVVRANTVFPQSEANELECGGGAIFNKGTLTIRGSRISGNVAEAVAPSPKNRVPGAGIDNLGTLRIFDSTISGNEAIGVYPTGGIASQGAAAHGATVELVGTRIEGNIANALATGFVLSAGAYVTDTDLSVRESGFTGNRGSGPGVRGAALIFGYEGTLAFESSIVAGNVSTGLDKATGTTGAIEVDGQMGDSMRIVNSTIAGNEALSPAGPIGGGIYHLGESKLEIASSTISGNSAVNGAGGNLRAFGGSPSLTLLRDTIVASGVAGPGSGNCSGNHIASAGHNIDSLDQCKFGATGDKVNTDPRLGPLAANGGSTMTLALLPGSPAIDTGLDCPALDQRGVARPLGPACDIGAFELEVPPATGPPPPPKSVVPPHAPTLAFLARKVVLSAKVGTGVFAASCGSDSGDRCVVDLSLTAKVKAPKRKRGAGASAKAKTKSVPVGSVSGVIAGGTTGQLLVELNRRGLALLAKRPGGFGVTASGVSRNASGAAFAVQGRLKLTPRHRARHRPDSGAIEARYTF